MPDSLLSIIARDVWQSQWQSQTTGMVAFVQATRSMKQCNLAALTWVLYDWFYTLADEVKYIWGSANTPPKILYLVSRYLGLLIALLPAADLLPFYCYERLTFTAITYHILFYSVQISLLIRVYAVWGQGKRLALALVIGFILLEGINLTMLIDGMLVFKANTIRVPSSWSKSGCVVLKFPTVMRYIWLPDLVFNTIMFVLSCIRCMPYMFLPDAPLVTIIFRDGAVYYVCMLLFLLLFTIGLLAGDVISYLDAFVAPILSVASSHLLLSIRAYVRAADRTSAAVTSFPLDFGLDDSTAAGSYELGACTTDTGRPTATNLDQTVTLGTVATEVLRGNAEADDGFGGPTLSFNARHEDLEAADPASAVDDDATLGQASRSRCFNGFSEWILAE